MTDPLAITEAPLPVPEIDIDLKDHITKLLVSRRKLEASMEEERRVAKKARREFLFGLLEIADALDRIVRRTVNPAENNPTVERLQGNIETTGRLLGQKLAKEGVTRMDLVNKTLDPNTADIEGYQDNPNLPDETVLRETVAGYWWNDEVLRRARVVVSRSE